MVQYLRFVRYGQLFSQQLLNETEVTMAKILLWVKDHKKILFKSSILFFSILSFFMFLIAFFVPFYASDTQNTAMIFGQYLNFQLNTFNYAEDLVIFLIFLAFMILSLVLSIITVTSFFSKKENYLPTMALGNTIYNFVFSTLFFLVGFAYCWIYDNGNPDLNYYSKAHIPFILNTVVLLIVSLLVTLYRREYIPLVDENGNEIKTNVREKKKYDFEGLIYSFVITVLSLITLAVNFLVINVDVISDQGSKSFSTSLNSWSLLVNYGSNNAANQILAFVLILFYVISGSLLVLVACSYFAKLQNYHNFVAASVITNTGLIFILSMAGVYFSIAQEMNKNYVVEVLTQSNIPVDSVEYIYNIHSDFIYVFVAEFIVLLVALCRKVFLKPKEELEEVKQNDQDPSEALSKVMDDFRTSMDDFRKDMGEQQKENFQSLTEALNDLNGTIKLQDQDEKDAQKTMTYDPCESFTNLEAKKDYFAKELEARKLTTKQNFTLKTLVEFIVNYAKDSPKHLSYTKETIACFISGLGFSRLSILQGMSGTGKTSLPKIFTEAIGGECRILEVESSWKDKNELIGYYNQFSKKFIPTKFTNALYEASLNPEIMFILVLDEMNLSRIEYYFSDFLSLMENDPDKRVLNLVNIPLIRLYQGKEVDYESLRDNQILPIPRNIWFVGTANNDESTFEISDKVYDRANTMDFDKRAKKIRDYTSPIPSEFVSSPYLTKLLNDAISKETFDAENYPVIQKVEALLSPYNISFGNRILKQIEEFVTIYNACFEEDRTFEAVETILLTKVVSKLRNKIVENKDLLQEKFEDLKLLKCAEFINRLNED